ncbi:aldehyde dehydrogenase family protein [Streptomyces sp. BF23-18]|uniref:aldehyde dehydrogenase family protein n=1 Tax=Streptomyces sp. BF23-18 TaxID=3240282 RepID=UPI0034E3A13F
MADLYVAGEWRDAAAGGRREIRCPADGVLAATVSEATRTDTEAAIAAARRAFDEGPWPHTPERERGALLLRTADLIGRDAKELARAESLDTGKRLVESEYDIADVVSCFRYYGGIGGTDAGRVIDTGRDDAVSRVVYEPIGVCELITPWNYPLLQASWKVAPALLAGNTIVLKPSELTPSTSILLMRALEEAGLPAGAANLVLGAGPEVGGPLCEDPAVPYDPEAEAGALISAQHREKVEAYVAAGLAEGAVLRCGGERPGDPALADGYYYPPTVLDACTQDMRVVHEESFGPVLTVERFTDEDDAVRIANDTEYGLAGAVWTQDAGKAQRVARRLRHGTVWINDYHPYVPQAEWGGFGHSGVGRELGPTGLDEYREPKHIWQNIQPRPQYWFRG